ncbi:PspC domain-containing protein [Arcanobacterium hippocoleae]
MDRFFQSLRNGNYRRTEDALFGGVCAGLAHHWRIAPILVRIAFLLLLCMGGMTFLIYGFAWILIPRDQDQK